jgi:hypothetical protein
MIGMKCTAYLFKSSRPGEYCCQLVFNMAQEICVPLLRIKILASNSDVWLYITEISIPNGIDFRKSLWKITCENFKVSFIFPPVFHISISTSYCRSIYLEHWGANEIWIHKDLRFILNPNYNFTCTKLPVHYYFLINNYFSKIYYSGVFYDGNSTLQQF